MADDGMLLNFEMGDGPISTPVKFKGGRWRDRVRAQKSVKSSRGNAPLHADESTGNRYDLDRDRNKDDGSQLGRASKRQKIEDAARSPSSGSRPASGPRKSNEPGGIRSRLFSANPAATTVFDEKSAVEDVPAEPSNAPLSDEAESFLALGLSRRVAHHLYSKLELKAPTAIQKHTIPQLLKQDHDAFLQAETGSGKTLAYLLPIVHRIMALSHRVSDGTSTGSQIHRDSGLFAIVLAPTRELCKQISAVLEKLLRCAPWLVGATVMGGESKKAEKARLRKGINILIATPGRLADHLDNTAVLDVGTVRWLVLDEGDRMMELGFEEDIRSIVTKIRTGALSNKSKDGVELDGALPVRRVTILCSATMKMNVQKLGEISLTEAVHITAATADEAEPGAGADDPIFTAPAQLKQTALIVPAKLRLVTLIALLRSSFLRRGHTTKAIIFFSCADSVDFHFALLKSTEPLNSPSTDPPTATKADGNVASRRPTSGPEATSAPAAYITSAANPTIILHRLHGSLPQPVRTSTLRAFSAATQPAVLFTTDISSRGLDVRAVELVIEYDPAFAIDDHLHRVGRTARAGKPGRAALFLQPGCEEGYLSLLPGSATQSYETVLQKGFATSVELPGSATPSPDPPPERQSYTGRAEALQLHIEQRLLQPFPGTEDPSSKDAATMKSANKRGRPAPPKDSALLSAARRAFRSHVRAYATHVRTERGYFDMTQLHLGHMAKAFGLREAPTGIGSGAVARRTYKAASSERTSRGGREDGVEAGGPGGEVDDDAARRMRTKMKAVMNVASEFNIG